MAKRIIIDLRSPLRSFERSMDSHNVVVPEHIKCELVNFVFDNLIYGIEGCYETPEFSTLGNFYRNFLENDPVLYKAFVKYFFYLLEDVIRELKANDLFTSDGFEFRPERFNGKNRSIVVKKFE